MWWVFLVSTLRAISGPQSAGSGPESSSGLIYFLKGGGVRSQLNCVRCGPHQARLGDFTVLPLEPRSGAAEVARGIAAE